MAKCEFCLKDHSRKAANSTGNPARYCSTNCIKRAWALRKNPDRKRFGTSQFFDTETGVGYKWEKWAAEKLGAVHLEFNSGGCDLQWGEKKVDVKACERYFRKKKRGRLVFGQAGWWVFNRNKLKPCDFFFCVCLENGDPVKTYLIPAEDFPRVGAVIGQRSKYDKYIMEF